VSESDVEGILGLVVFIVGVSFVARSRWQTAVQHPRDSGYPLFLGGAIFNVPGGAFSGLMRLKSKQVHNAGKPNAELEFSDSRVTCTISTARATLGRYAGFGPAGSAFGTTRSSESIPTSESGSSRPPFDSILGPGRTIVTGSSSCSIAATIARSSRA
jgi:hypothetical protein